MAWPRSLLVGVLVALFAGGLVLIGVISAWRAAVWTVEVGRDVRGSRV